MSYPHPLLAVLVIVAVGVAQTVYLIAKFNELENLLKKREPPESSEKIACIRCGLLIDTHHHYCPWCGASQYGETLVGCVRDLYNGLTAFLKERKR